MKGVLKNLHSIKIHKNVFSFSGEANTEYHKDNYNCSFPTMINDWRMAFHQGSGGQTAPDFPFGFVQVCSAFGSLYLKKSQTSRRHKAIVLFLQLFCIRYIIYLHVQLSTDKEGATDDGFPDIRWHQTADVGFVPNIRMKNTFMAVSFDLPDKTSPYGT